MLLDVHPHMLINLATHQIEKYKNWRFFLYFGHMFKPIVKKKKSPHDVVKCIFFFWKNSIVSFGLPFSFHWVTKIQLNFFLTNPSRTTFFLNFNFLNFSKVAIFGWNFMFYNIFSNLKRKIAQYFTIEKRLVYMKI